MAQTYDGTVFINTIRPRSFKVSRHVSPPRQFYHLPLLSPLYQLDINVIVSLSLLIMSHRHALFDARLCPRQTFCECSLSFLLDVEMLTRHFHSIETSRVEIRTMSSPHY